MIAATTAPALSHPHAPAIEVLDHVMKGRAGQVLDFTGAASWRTNAAAPHTPFGQVVAEAIDGGMTPEEWCLCTADDADPRLRDVCLGLWRTEVWPKFEARYQVSVSGLPQTP